MTINNPYGLQSTCQIALKAERHHLKHLLLFWKTLKNSADHQDKNKKYLDKQIFPNKTENITCNKWPMYQLNKTDQYYLVSSVLNRTDLGVSVTTWLSSPMPIFDKHHICKS